MLTNRQRHYGLAALSARRVGGGVERSRRWTSRNLSTPARTTKTCYARPWRLLGYRQAARLRKDAPPVRGFRMHALCHTFATLQLSSGVHFMQVSKWLDYSAFTLTLDVYGDYIPEGDGGIANNLPEPPAPEKQADLPNNVVSLFGRQAN